MRRSFGWWLAASLLLTAVSLLTRRTEGVVSAIAPQVRERQQQLRDVQRVVEIPAKTWSALPTLLPHLALEEARRDIFASLSPPARAVPDAVPPVPPVVAPQPQAPQAPPSTARFLGRMLTPEGKLLTFIAVANHAVAVSDNLQLEDGYRVESISSNAITLQYGSLDQRVTLQTPPAKWH